MTWKMPIDVSQYDRRGPLDEAERLALDEFLFQLSKRRRFPRTTPANLARLLQPIEDVLAWFDTRLPFRNATLRYFLREMQRQQMSYWGWSDAVWLDFLKPNGGPFRKDLNHHLMVIAWLLAGFTDLRNAYAFRAEVFLVKVFGSEVLDEAVDTVTSQLLSWGFSGNQLRLYVNRSLCYLFIKTRSPRLQDLTMEALTWMYEEGSNASERAWIPRISRVLAELGIIDKPMYVPSPTQGKRIPCTGMSTVWAEYCQRWHTTALMAGKTRASVLLQLYKVGRWLYQRHPEVVSPADWTRDICIDFLADLQNWKIGDYIGSQAKQLSLKWGQPLNPKSQKAAINALSIFFRDCQDWEWFPVRFDPRRTLATPRSLSRLIGPAPRVIADDIWAKLMWAGLNLTQADVPPVNIRNELYPLPLIRALALTWLFAGLRLNEILRLRVGCIRFQSEQYSADGATQNRVCLLDIPVTKTSTAFTKPVASIVGEAIQAWEAIRPKQPLATDSKTGERVHFLFTYRGKSIGRAYINHALIPLLCRKAGVPEADARGRFTSHRARATIATQLANTHDPMSLLELQQWLGHQTPNATLWYLRSSPMRLNQAYSNAGYFDRNLRAISVLIDQDAVRNGTSAQGAPWRYYDLGHGYCTYDFFDQCPHRMTCAKCSFYQPKDSSHMQLLEAQGNLQRMLQEIPLTEAEQLAVQDGMEALQNLQARLLDVPTPTGMTPRQIQTTSGLILPDTIPVHISQPFIQE